MRSKSQKLMEFHVCCTKVKMMQPKTVNDPSACWIPEIKVEREIHGTDVDRPVLDETP